MFPSMVCLTNIPKLSSQRVNDDVLDWLAYASLRLPQACHVCSLMVDCSTNPIYSRRTSCCSASIPYAHVLCGPLKHAACLAQPSWCFKRRSSFLLFITVESIQPIRCPRRKASPNACFCSSNTPWVYCFRTLICLPLRVTFLNVVILTREIRV